MDSGVITIAKIQQFKRQDRISHLPDKILHCIFSFLPTDDVVRTTGRINSWSDIFNWLVYATRHNVVDLELIVDDDRSIAPSCLISSQSLQYLTLGEFLILECDILLSVCFPNLKFLSLILSNDYDFEFATQLVSTCPALRELVIKFSHHTEPGSLLELESSSLIKLVLELCSDIFSACGKEFCSILISAPNLVHLEVSATIVARYLVGSTSSIQLVRLDIGPCCGLNPVSILCDSVPNKMKFDHSISAHGLLREISKALIAGYGNELPTLSNLVRLDIGVPYLWCLNLVPHLLRNAPELKILVLRKDCIHEDNCLNENEWIVSDAWIDFPLLHLEVIEIEEFQGKEGELELIKYLLKNGKMLKKFIVRSKISDANMSLYEQARALLEWHNVSQFCGSCGERTIPMEAGKRRQCCNDRCKKRIYPRVDPVVIMLVIDRENDRALLSRQSRFVPRMWSCLAGFLEPGESLEKAVRRETWEETGIEVGEVIYHSSQPWPVGPSSMPCQLMVGFFAYAKSLEINVDKEELDDAQWHSRENVKNALTVAEYEKAQKNAAAKVDQMCKGVEKGQTLSGDFNVESGELAPMFVPGPFAIAHHLISSWAYQGTADDFRTNSRPLAGSLSNL